MKFFNIAARNVTIAAFFAVSGAALVVSAVATAADSAPAMKISPEHKAEMEKHRQEMFRHMSDRIAERLEIKPSQQAAFQAYTTALQAAFTPPANHPEYKSDAASIARMNADKAAEHARRLATIADATAKFQEVLSPEQRKTFDQMAAAFMHHHHGMHRGFGHGEHGWGHDGEHDGHGGQEEHHGWGQDGGHEHRQDGGQHN